jgi:hypothetical protein
MILLDGLPFIGGSFFSGPILQLLLFFLQKRGAPDYWQKLLMID